LQSANSLSFETRHHHFAILYLSSLHSGVHSGEKVASLPHPTLLFSVLFKCSVSCMLDVRVNVCWLKVWKNSPLFATKIVICFKGLGFEVIFLLHTAADIFFVWCQRTPLDELYGITNPLIDVNRGLYEVVGIHEVPAFHSKKKRPAVVFFHFSLQFLSF